MKVKMKRCPKCKQFLPKAKFGKDGKTKDGLFRQCKKCKSEYDKKYRFVHRQDIKCQQKKYRLTHQQQIKEHRKKYNLLYRRQIKESLHRHFQDLRSRAVEIVGKGKLTCVDCDCDDIRLLEINHKNGGGNKEYRSRGYSRFFNGIISGRRKTDDLNLLCKVCNARHAAGLKYGKDLTKHWEIKWR